MSFTTIIFYCWLAVAVVLFYLIPAKFRVSFILVISCVFYLTISPRYLVLMLVLTFIVFQTGRGLRQAQSETSRTLLLIAGIFPVLGSLIVFKFGGSLSQWLLPIGISYYSFKLISYVVEVYWEPSNAVGSIVEFASYVTFGPQMISGPIQRPCDYFSQLKRQREGGTDYARIEDGMRLILGGLLLKMLIGDRLADFVGLVDKNPAAYTRPVVLLSTLCYAIQLYADFAGYTNIALGIGKLFGIDGPANFNAPFAAANIQNFWRRWHMSLTTWLTDYVFMPMRMSTRTLGAAGLAASIVTTFVLVGVWHGFYWTFLVFGLLHGIFMTVSALTLHMRDRFFKGTPESVRRTRAALGIVSTYLLVTFSQIWFWAPSVGAAIFRIKQLAGVVPSGLLSLTDIKADISLPLFACIPIAFYLGAGSPGFRRWWAPVGGFIPNWALYGAGMLALSLMTTESGSKFIYGQF
jgi:D-alanyl-lipoteichoic acid acyltransferase DltB (MBOAT superfamily)